MVVVGHAHTHISIFYFAFKTQLLPNQLCADCSKNSQEGLHP